jgi:tRNA nucleotidyltransferase (CCA-adding enzyme)
MGRSRNNLVVHDLRGHVGKQIVVKKYGDKTFIGAYPDMSNIKPSRLQKTNRRSFADAVAYAKDICNDPVKKAAYAKKIGKGQRVYNSAIREYMNGK